jgi:hypothetical protein
MKEQTIGPGDEASISMQTLMEEHGGGSLTEDPENVANLSYGTQKETSVHVLCECEVLALFRHT